MHHPKILFGIAFVVAADLTHYPAVNCGGAVHKDRWFSFFI